MMQPVCTLGSISAGSCGAGPIIDVCARPTGVFINGKPILTIGNFWNAHCAGKWCHPEFTIVGAPNVFSGGAPVVRVGDPLSNGDIAAVGSYNVFA